MASALLWRVLCVPPAGLVCPAGGLSFDVVVSPGGGSFWPRLSLGAAGY